MIRIGIVGAGGAGWVHGRLLGHARGVQIAAVCDPSVARLEDLARKWRIPARYADYRQMLAREDLDGICNCTPDAVHAEVALAAIRRGVPVLSEKPMATSVAEARRMYLAAGRRGSLAMLNFPYRRSGALEQAARLIRAGRLGRVLHVEASCLQSWLAANYWGPWSAPNAVWKLSSRGGGLGALGDLGCHLLDFVTRLCGDIAQIDCRLKCFPKGVRGETVGGYPLDANDSLAATVEFAGGALGVLHASRWATGHHNSMRARVYGDRGAVELDLDTSPHLLRLVSGRAARHSATWRWMPCRPAPMPLERFVRAIRAGRAAQPDFLDGLKNQAQLAACLESARRNRPVRVEQFGVPRLPGHRSTR